MQPSQERAPRGQLPYIVDDGETIGDSDTIIAHLISKHQLKIDSGLTAAQRDTSLLISRMLDDLYWVMSYSRWKDERFYPAFCAALLREHPNLTEAGLRKAQEFNLQRYYFQGIGRFTPAAAYARGLADLQILANLIPAGGYVHGSTPTSIDAGIYGFLANIYFYEIETPLKQFLMSPSGIARQSTPQLDRWLMEGGMCAQRLLFIESRFAHQRLRYSQNYTPTTKNGSQAPQREGSTPGC